MESEAGVDKIPFCSLLGRENVSETTFHSSEHMLLVTITLR
jgi:hypothetical protein